MLTLFCTDHPACPPPGPPDEHPFARLAGWAVFDSPVRHGIACSTRPTRTAGIGVHHTHTLLGLRAWRDTWEAQGQVIYELEKVIRMLLRQSTLAADILCSIPESDVLPSTLLIEAALTSRMPTAYAQLAHATHQALHTMPDQVTVEEALHALRHLLTGATLATHAHLCIHLPSLLARHDDPCLTQLATQLDVMPPASSLPSEVRDGLRTHLDALLEFTRADHPRNCLPDAPTGYDVLHEFLITQRLGASS